MVMSVPATSMGLKLLSEVVPKVVFPAKVTVEPVFSFVKRMVELAGAEMPERTMLVHEATAEVIEAYSVTVHVTPVPAAAVEVVLVVVVVDFTLLEVVAAFVVEVVAVVVVTSVVAVVLAVTRQLQALEILAGLFEQ